MFQPLRRIGNFMDQFLSSNFLHVLICCLGGLCCFLPLFGDTPSYLEDTKLKRTLTQGNSFRDSSVASLALASPLALDILMDVGISLIKKIRVIPTEPLTPQTCLNNMEKTLCLLGIIVVPLAAFVPDYNNLALVFVCCNKCQSFVVGATVMTSICRCNRNRWTVISTLTFLLLLIFAQITSTFSLNTSVSSSNNTFNNNMVAAADVCTMMAVSLMLLCSIQSLFTLSCQAYNDVKSVKLIRPNETGSERHSRNYVFFSICWLAIFVVGVVFLIAISQTYGSIIHFNETALLLNSVTYLSFELAITILTMRMVKFDVVKGLYALIDSKKSYVRYISHELRTPLNTAFLGLKLLTDDLQSSRDSKDAERYDTLRDVNLSCKAALDILNDLLCFDKLESGILELHKQETHIIPFVTECIAMFASQARANDVKMNFVNTGCAPDEAATCRCSFVSTEISGDDREAFNRLPSMPIVQSESILIDKFKMDQVVRNLISNALKFTPKGGSINIKISHIPNTDTQNDQRKRPPSPVKRSRSPASIFMSTNSNSSAEISAMNDDIECGLDFTFTDGTLLLEVSDTGAGISPENQKRLFKDIVQFNPEILQAGGGSGLGLWITKGIVDLHNGKISVYSEGEGMGCKFSVELPMLRKAGFEVMPGLNPSRRPSASSAERGLSFSESSHYDDAYLFETLSKSWMASDADPIPAATMSTGLNYVLLVVDDSRLNRKMLCKILRGAGCLCDEAEDGLQAIEIVKQKMSHPNESKRFYDAILMDYIMPQLDGPTATKRIRALNYTAPIFGVTGNALGSDVDYFVGCGADRIFAKPLNVAEFELHMKSITPGTELNHDDIHTFT